jgi:hypothetical protein
MSLIIAYRTAESLMRITYALYYARRSLRRGIVSAGRWAVATRSSLATWEPGSHYHNRHSFFSRPVTPVFPLSYGINPPVCIKNRAPGRRFIPDTVPQSNFSFKVLALTTLLSTAFLRWSIPMQRTGLNNPHRPRLYYMFSLRRDENNGITVRSCRVGTFYCRITPPGCSNFGTSPARRDCGGLASGIKLFHRRWNFKPLSYVTPSITGFRQNQKFTFAKPWD